jgi:3-isopropylmalate/(R)-2-methylmalate dehydratase small subunit
MSGSVIEGKVFVVGDHIDTDQIISAKFLNLVPTIPEEYEKLGSHALGGLPDDYPPFVKEGSVKSEYSIVIAGRNFGCGSSREHAPVALGAAGVRAVVAESYARIFFRNCMATGEFYPCEFEKDENAEALFATGDTAVIDMEKGFVLNAGNGKKRKLLPLGDAAEVIADGGIFGYARKKGMISA